MSESFNDGGLGFGCRKVKFFSQEAAKDANGSSQWIAAVRGIVVLEDFNPRRPTSEANRHDEVNLPSGSVNQEDFVTCSCTAQLQNVTSARLHRGDAFTTDCGYGNESFAITEASDPESQGAIRKQTITVKKLYAATSLPPAYP